MRDKMNDDTTDALLTIIAKYAATSVVGIESRLQSDLGIDSFDMVNIAIEAQEKFGFTFPGRNLPYLATVDDVIGFIRKLRCERV